MTYEQLVAQPLFSQPSAHQRRAAASDQGGRGGGTALGESSAPDRRDGVRMRGAPFMLTQLPRRSCPSSSPS